MTKIELALILGTVWIAPHSPWWLGQLVGLIFIGIASAMGMGWL